MLSFVLIPFQAVVLLKRVDRGVKSCKKFFFIFLVNDDKIECLSLASHSSLV
jgi:hypothetical protein